MIDVNQFYGILRDIVQRYPYDKCKQLQTFGVYENMIDFSKPSLGFSVDDYYKNYYWSRDWEQAGAKENDLCVQYPALLTSLASVTPKDPQEGVYCYSYDIIIADKFDCQECGGCNRPKAEVEGDSASMLATVLSELGKYAKFLIEEDGETYEIWATHKSIEDCYTDAEETCEALEFDENLSIEGNIDPYYRNGEKLTGFVVTVNVCTCIKSDIEFDCKPSNIKQKGVTKCVTCG